MPRPPVSLPRNAAFYASVASTLQRHVAVEALYMPWRSMFPAFVHDLVMIFARVHTASVLSMTGTR